MKILKYLWIGLFVVAGLCIMPLIMGIILDLPSFYEPVIIIFLICVFLACTVLVIWFCTPAYRSGVKSGNGKTSTILIVVGLFFMVILPIAISHTMGVWEHRYKNLQAAIEKCGK